MIESRELKSNILRENSDLNLQSVSNTAGLIMTEGTPLQY